MYTDQPKTGRSRVLSASTMIGDDVVNAAGDTLGKLEEIMIDNKSGCVAYGVLSFGGFMGIGDKLFAIPWNAFQLDPENKRLLLDVPRERLENAPGFDKNNWPNFADESFGRQIHDYYGTQHYSERYR